MSWAATSYVKKLRKAPNGEAITKGEKLVMLVIADYHNDERGDGWVSIKRLALESLHSRRGVVKTVQALERKGVLSVHRSPDAATKRITNRYRFPELEAPPQPRTGEVDSLGLGKGVHQAREASSTGLGKPVIHIFPEDLSSDLSKDRGVGRLPDRVRGDQVIEQPKSTETWEAYADAFRRRYRTDPVRNRRTNAQLCQLVDRLGIAEAPAVAAFYVSLSLPFYVSRYHSVTLLLRDAETIRTQWATGSVLAFPARTVADLL